MNKNVKSRAIEALEQLAYRNFVFIDALGELLCKKGLITHGEWRHSVRKISSVCITAVHDLLYVDDLPEHLRKLQGRAGAAGERWRPLPLEEVRRLHIQRVLEMCKGNHVRAAQILGIGRTSLYRYLKRKGKAKASTAARRNAQAVGHYLSPDGVPPPGG